MAPLFFVWGVCHMSDLVIPELAFSQLRFLISISWDSKNTYGKSEALNCARQSHACMSKKYIIFYA